MFSHTEFHDAITTAKELPKINLTVKIPQNVSAHMKTLHLIIQCN